MNLIHSDRLKTRTIGLCAFIACMTPRYITTFKIHIGMSISFFTILTLLAWLFLSGKLVFSKSPDNILFTFWLALTTIDVLFTKSIGDWLYYFAWIVTAYFFMQLVYACSSDLCYEYIGKAMVFALQIHLVIGFYEIYFHTHLFHTGGYGVRYFGITPISIFHNPNDYATYTVTVLPLDIYFAVNSEKKPVKLFYLLSSAICVYLIIMTQSRAAILALIGGVMCYLIIKYRKTNAGRISIFFAVMLVIIVGIASDQLRSLIIAKLVENSVNTSLHGDANRVNLIKNGLYFLKETWGFGIGAGNIRFWLMNKSIYYISVLEYLHNWYVELLVTYGIVFFASYMICHAKTMLNLYRRAIQNKAKYDFDSALLTSLFMFSIVCITSSCNAYSEWIWMYYVFLFSYALHFNPGISKNQRNSFYMNKEI